MKQCVSEPAVIELPVDESASADVQIVHEPLASVTHIEEMKTDTTIDDIVRTVVEDLIVHTEEAKVSSASA